jgi:hypothetical protein
MQRCPLTGACPVRTATTVWSWCLPNLSRPSGLFLHGLPMTSLPCLWPGKSLQVLWSCFSVQVLIASLAEHLGILRAGSGPGGGISDACRANLSASSLPRMPRCPGTQTRVTSFRPASVERAKQEVLHSILRSFWVFTSETKIQRHSLIWKCILGFCQPLSVSCSTPLSGRSWVSSRVALNRCGKSCPYRDSISGPSSPFRVAILTAIPRPTFCFRNVKDKTYAEKGMRKKAQGSYWTITSSVIRQLRRIRFYLKLINYGSIFHSSDVNSRAARIRAEAYLSVGVWRWLHGLPAVHGLMAKLCVCVCFFFLGFR